MYRTRTAYWLLIAHSVSVLPRLTYGWWTTRCPPSQDDAGGVVLFGLSKRSANLSIFHLTLCSADSKNHRLSTHSWWDFHLRWKTYEYLFSISSSPFKELKMYILSSHIVNIDRISSCCPMCLFGRESNVYLSFWKNYLDTIRKGCAMSNSLHVRTNESISWNATGIFTA